MDMDKVHSEGADIFYQVEGEGPYLLLVPGGGGPRFSRIVDALSQHYSVIRYDRRCNSLSTGNPAKPLDLDQQARDIAAVLDALDVKKTWLFGNSGGACIALKCAEDFPEKVLGVIAHEPPAIGTLTDADRWFTFSDEVERAYEEQGLVAAVQKFDSAMKGFERSGELGNATNQKNLAYFMECELHALCRYQPSIDKLSAARVPFIFASGILSEDAYYARPAKIIAEQLTHARYVSMSGHHFSFATEPDVFAHELLGLLAELSMEDVAS